MSPARCRARCCANAARRARRDAALRAIKRAAIALATVLDDVDVPWPGGTQRRRSGAPTCTVYRCTSSRTNDFFGRPNVYGHDDDIDRFLFFCDALLAAAPHLGFAPDVVHAQDWHTALLLTRLAGDPGADHPWARCGRVYTIHNLALQGTFTRDLAAKHGIAPRAACIAPTGSRRTSR